MKQDWNVYLGKVTAQLRVMRAEHPEVMKNFGGLAQAVTKTQALDGKTQEKITLGISVAVRCDDYIGFHVKAALQHRTIRAEIMETVGMAIYMGAGPAVMYATHLL